MLNNFSDSPANLDNNIMAPTIAPIITVTPVRPLAIPFQSNDPSFTIAEDKIRIDVAIPSITVTAFAAPKPRPSILLNKAIAPTNSPNNIVIPVSAGVNLPGSIEDNIHNDPARMAIADAILISVPACRFCCQLFKESSTEPRISFILSINLKGPSNDSVIPPIYFLIPINMEANKPPLSISRSDFTSPFLKALPRALPIPARAVPTAPPIF